MADGRTHAAWSTTAASALTVASLAALAVSPATVGIAVGAWIGHIVTPDIDHHATTYEERRMYRINIALGVLWQLYWTPYQKMSRHRGRSHSWAGTVERFCYLLWLPVCLSLWLEPDALIVQFWCMVFIGQLLVDCVHFWLDR